MNSKIIKSTLPLIKATDLKASTFYRSNAITSCFMTQTANEYSILMYDLNIIAPDDINVVSKIDESTIEIKPSSVTINDILIEFDLQQVTIELPSYTYILVSPEGDIIQHPSYIENYAILAIVTATATGITNVYNFMQDDKCILYKSQINVDDKWIWDSNAHILASGEYPKFTLDNNILTILYGKNGVIFKRTLDINGDIAEFQYTYDYPINNNTIALNTLNDVTAIKSSSNILGTPYNANPFKLDSGAYGLVSDPNTLELSYKLQIPVLSNRNIMVVKYTNITSIHLYDNEFNIIESYPFNMMTKLIDIPNKTDTFHIGFEGEFSLYNKRCNVTQILFNVNNLLSYKYNENINDIQNLSVINSSMNAGFNITKSYEFDTHIQDEYNTINSSMNAGFNITKSYEFDNHIQDEYSNISSSMADVEFTINRGI